ncbi:uncharacterized protein METZ01_LOCUS485787, partial [marine metagenome]
MFHSQCPAQVKLVSFYQKSARNEALIDIKWNQTQCAMGPLGGLKTAKILACGALFRP